MEPARYEFATEEEYLARERRSPEKHEYVDGRIVAMAGGSPRHNLISGNVLGALRSLLRGRCRAFSSDQRIFIPATGLYTYPDVTTVCGPLDLHPPLGNTIRNPHLVVEVLSRSTEAYDRGEKFAHYRTVPSLAEYLLVGQGTRRVELYRRVEVGRWELTEAVDDGTITLATLNIALPLEEIYADTEDLPPGD